LNLYQSTGFLVNKLGHLMAVELDKRLNKYGVTISQWTILALLWEKEGLSQNEIQELLGIEGSTVSGLIQRMTKNGLIYRGKCQLDKRIQRVYLTDKGHDLKKNLISEAKEVNQMALQGFSNDEHFFFHNLLKRALKNFS